MGTSKLIFLLHNGLAALLRVLSTSFYIQCNSPMAIWNRADVAMTS